MKKRVISFVFVFVIFVSLFSVSALALDTSRVTIKYQNKIDNDKVKIGCFFGESGGDLPFFTQKNQRFSTFGSVGKLEHPEMYIRIWRDESTLHFNNGESFTGINGVYDGVYDSFGTKDGDGYLTFSVTFEGAKSALNFMKPNVDAIQLQTFSCFLGQEDDCVKYLYIQPKDFDFTVSVKEQNGVNYYTYTVGFLESKAAYPFKQIRLAFSFDGGNYSYWPLLRDFSGSSMSKYDYENSLQAEKNEAQSSGNDSVDQLTGAIGVDTSGFLKGFQRLATAMSYDGIDAQWTLPAISIPKIDGVTDKLDLSDEKPINLVQFVSSIPNNILSIIRAVFDIALVIFCAKELYGLVSYLFTLKGGGVDG